MFSFVTMENILKFDADWINKSSINSIVMLKEREREKNPECKSVYVIFSNWLEAKWLGFTVRNVKKQICDDNEKTNIHPSECCHTSFIATQKLCYQNGFIWSDGKWNMVLLRDLGHFCMKNHSDISSSSGNGSGAMHFAIIYRSRW